MIRGENVVLVNTTQIGTDPFGAPIYDEQEELVSNVVVGNPSTDDVVSDLGMYGKSLLFVLGIPKGDTHDWKDKVVKIRGVRFKTYGNPLIQTEANVPGAWNTQVKVERYEG